MAARFTGFDVGNHGWAFANDGISLCESADCVAEHGGIHIPAQFVATTYPWALCGGMSLSALRRFRAQTPVEPLTYQVKRELMSAQLETVNESFSKFFTYSMRFVYLRPSLGAITNQNWQIVKSYIDQGIPVILGLIYVRSYNPVDVFRNHQVLAIGYEYTDGGKTVLIWIYDPNFPNRSSRIELVPGKAGKFAHIAQRTFDAAGNVLDVRDANQERNIYGFFRIAAGSEPQPNAFSGYSGFRKQTSTALHQTDESFCFGLLPEGDLMAIKKSDTDTNSTEIHILKASDNYRSFKMQTGTALHETGDNFDFFVMANGDLMAIKKSDTDTNSTEIHILKASDNYRSFKMQTGTALHETGDNFDFCVMANGDLMAIKKSDTGTDSTEIHVLSARSSYRRFRRQTGTALHETDEAFAFALMRNGDLMAIKKFGTVSNSTEVHILKARGGYQSFRKQTGTALQETGSDFAFAVMENGDLMAIKKRGTGSGTTEVHILSA